MLGKTMGVAAVILGAFAIAGAALVGITYETTKDQIVENERQSLLKSLYELIPQEEIDNDIYNDNISITDPEWLGAKGAVAIYRARKGGQPVAAVIASEAPDGYSGTIKLLVAIRYNGELGGVRVVTHKETPGLGDGIEVARSDWILGFNGRSLNNPDEKGWKVKKDGGIFDEFTGATITPRAIVKAVHKSLKFFDKNKQKLFESSPPAQEGK